MKKLVPGFLHQLFLRVAKVKLSAGMDISNIKTCLITIDRASFGKLSRRYMNLRLISNTNKPKVKSMLGLKRTKWSHNYGIYLPTDDQVELLHMPLIE